jgi:hypothetical protein
VMGSYRDILPSLLPLRNRAHKVQAQAAQSREAELARWSSTDKSALKEQTASLKEALQVLAKEEEALTKKVSSLATTTISSHPGTTTGFNVIRSRVDAKGQPLGIDALRGERQRLVTALDQINIDIAAAKSEVMQHRRWEEQDIWETKLVALQVRRAPPTPQRRLLAAALAPTPSLLSYSTPIYDTKPPHTHIYL